MGLSAAHPWLCFLTQAQPWCSHLSWTRPRPWVSGGGAHHRADVLSLPGEGNESRCSWSILTSQSAALVPGSHWAALSFLARPAVGKSYLGMQSYIGGREVKKEEEGGKLEAVNKASE